MEAGFEHILTSFDISPEPEKLIGGRGRSLLIASRWPLVPLDQEWTGYALEGAPFIGLDPNAQSGY